MFLDLLRAAAQSEAGVNECAQHCHMTLPGSLFCDFIAETSSGGPIGIIRMLPTDTNKSQDDRNWELCAVELTTEPDFTTVAKPHKFAPPCNYISDPEAEKTWWRETLHGLEDLISIVQQVQFTKAPSVKSWEQLPLLIWA